IAEIETDKATMEVEAADEGTLGKILVPEGTADVAVNTPIAVILGEGEDKSAIKDAKPSQLQKAAESAPPAKAEKNETKAPATQAPRKQDKAPQAPEAKSSADPDIPEGTEMVNMNLREALRDAM